MAYANFTAIRDLLTVGGGVPKSNKIRTGTVGAYVFHMCELDAGVWATTTDAADLISAATCNAIKDGTVNGDNTLTYNGLVYQVGRWQDPGGVWWCKLLDP
jgi:hypothetical protein